MDDLTECKRAEEALKLNEDRLETLLKLSQMKVESEKELTDFALEEGVRLTKSKVGYLHFFSEDHQHIQLNSWSRDVLNTCTAERDSHYPLDKAGIWADCIRVRQPVVYNDYKNLIDKKGYPEGHVPITRHMSVPIIDDGLIVGVAGVGNKEEPYDDSDVRQLTLFMNSMWRILKQRRADELLLREKKFSDSTIDSLPGIFYLFDAKGNFLRWNKNFEAVSGCSAEEISGMSPLDFFTGEDRRLIEQKIKEVFIKGEATAEAEFVSKDGHKTPYFFTGKRTTFDNRECLIGTGLDISERKNLERQRSDFFAMVTHDLKSPLTLVMGYSEYLLMERADRLDDDVKDMINTIHGGGAKLLHMVEDFLAVSKMESEKPVLCAVQAEVPLLLWEAGKELEMAIEEKRLVLNMEAEAGLPTVFMDQRLVLRAVVNLLQNAVNYTPAGGNITLSAKKEGGKEGGFVVISVADDGPGITPEERARVFEKYYRSPKTAVVKGTGLGLYIVKAVADAHGGRVELESEPGKGSTFRLYLPLPDQRDGPAT